MARKTIDCRDWNQINRQTGTRCTLVTSGEEDEVLQATVEHCVTAHGLEDTPQLRAQVLASMRDAEPATA